MVVDGVFNNLHVDLVDGVPVGGGWNNAVLQERLDLFIYSAGARWKSDDIMGWVTRLHRSSQVLRRKQVQVILVRQNLRLRVQLINGCSRVTAGDETQDICSG